MSAASLEGLSTDELQAELRRRQKGLQSLVRKRDKLREDLERVEAEIREHGGVMAGVASIGGARRRARNDSNLADALGEVLSEQVYSVTEVAEEVQRRGYITTSPNFRTIVNQTLVKDPRFERVARGRYAVKNSPAAKNAKSNAKPGSKKTGSKKRRGSGSSSR